MTPRTRAGRVGTRLFGAAIGASALFFAAAAPAVALPSTQGALSMDPNTGDYSCDSDSCVYEDGTTVPDEERCGLQCDEPPTAGEGESHYAPFP